MASGWWSYDMEHFITALTAAKRDTSKGILSISLKKGIHPFFLQQLLRFVWKSESLLVGEDFMRPREMKLLEKHSKKIQSVPAPWAAGPTRAFSRLYERGWMPRRGLDTGVFHGALLEHILDFLDIRSGQSLPSVGIDVAYVSALRRLFDHPDADIRMCANAIFLSLVLGSIVRQDDSDFAEFNIEPLIREVLKNQVATAGLEKVTTELLGVWSDSGAWVFWSLTQSFLSAAEDLRLDHEFTPSADFLGCLLDQAKSGSASMRSAAIRVCELYPALKKDADQINAQAMVFTKTLLIDGIKEELPDVRAFHALVRWIQFLPLDLREGLVLDLLFQGFGKTESESHWIIDSRAEYLLEEFLGKETWGALCVLQDARFWKHVGKGTAVVRGFRAEPDRSIPQYTAFLKSLREADLHRHDWQLAKSVDIAITDVGSDLKTAQAVSEEMLNLLAGDSILAVTHLRTEWMAVRRKKTEFLGELFSTIDVARHPKFGNNGAACKFLIVAPGLPDKPLTGTLDPEGSIELDQIVVLTPLGRHALQAVVLQSVAAVLIPQYLDALPKLGRKGGGVEYTGEFWASRPVVHTRGDLTEEEDQKDVPWGSTRINPAIAQVLFSWLLDDLPECPFRLYRKVTQGGLVFYATWREAKSLLYSGEASLSGVYYRTIRAHSKPVGVIRDDQGNYSVQQMSDAAKRKYEWYRTDIGREFDFSQVRKTYELPGGRRISLDVPRTFNQGTFNSLEEVWRMVPDLSLRARAKTRFKL